MGQYQDDFYRLSSETHYCSTTAGIYATPVSQMQSDERSVDPHPTRAETHIIYEQLAPRRKHSRKCNPHPNRAHHPQPHDWIATVGLASRTRCLVSVVQIPKRHGTGAKGTREPTQRIP